MLLLSNKMYKYNFSCPLKSINKRQKKKLNNATLNRLDLNISEVNGHIDHTLCRVKFRIKLFSLNFRYIVISLYSKGMGGIAMKHFYATDNILFFSDWHRSYYANLRPNKEAYDLLISSGVFSIINAAIFLVHIFLTFKKEADY